MTVSLLARWFECLLVKATRFMRLLGRSDQEKKTLTTDFLARPSRNQTKATTDFTDSTDNTDKTLPIGIRIVSQVLSD